MAKDHGPSVKDDKQYEGLRKKGMRKERPLRPHRLLGCARRYIATGEKPLANWPRFEAGAGISMQ